MPLRSHLQSTSHASLSGLLHNLGLCFTGVMKFQQAAKELGLPKLVSIQNNYSLLVRVHFDVNLGEVCHKYNENVALLAYSPLAG